MQMWKPIIWVHWQVHLRSCTKSTRRSCRSEVHKAIRRGKLHLLVHFFEGQDTCALLVFDTSEAVMASKGLHMVAWSCFAAVHNSFAPGTLRLQAFVCGNGFFDENEKHWARSFFQNDMSYICKIMADLSCTYEVERESRKKTLQSNEQAERSNNPKTTDAPPMVDLVVSPIVWLNPLEILV